MQATDGSPRRSRAERSALAVLTSFVGTWHAHLRDGGDDGVVVAVALADQVDDPVRDVLDGAPVQAVVVGRLEATGAKSSLRRVAFLGFKSRAPPPVSARARCQRMTRGSH